jgi:hypothetical protein
MFMHFSTPSQTNGEFWDFRGKINPLMKSVVIVTPKGTSFSKTASYEPLRVKIGRPVRPVHDIKKLKKTPKAATSTNCRGKNPRGDRHEISSVARSYRLLIVHNMISIGQRLYSWRVPEKRLLQMEASIAHTTLPRATALACEMTDYDYHFTFQSCIICALSSTRNQQISGF